MLRGLGIPSRVIKGYRDVEAMEDDDPDDDVKVDGDYVVRQSQAHSWVQALVPEDGQWFWVNLDPTPSAEAARTETSALTWLLQNLRDGRQFWNNFILEYNNEIQIASVKSLRVEAERAWRWAGRYALLALPLPLLAWLAWHLRRRWRWSSADAAVARNGAAGPAFYARYLHVLADRFNLVPQLGQTPLEFNRVAADILRADPRCNSWTMLPELYTNALYRVDYGGATLAESEHSTLAAQLTALEQATATK